MSLCRELTNVLHRNMDSVDWSSDEVEALFTTPGSPNGDDESKADPDTSTPVGAIAGGVIGGVAGVAIIAGVVWFMLKRRRQRSHPEPSEPAQYEPATPSKSPAQAQTGTPSPPYEVVGSYGRTQPAVVATAIELPAPLSVLRPLSELQGTGTSSATVPLAESEGVETPSASRPLSGSESPVTREL